MNFKVGRSTSTAGNSEAAALAGDRVVITRDSILQWKLEGRVFYAQQGNEATKLDFVETTYAVAEPQFALCIPAGLLVIPLAMNITLEDTSGATEGMVLWSTATVDIGNGTSTPLVPVNYRRDSVFAPACRANSLYTGVAATATGLIEVKRWFVPFASNNVQDGYDLHNYDWGINDPSMPVLLGPATLQFHLVATGDGYLGYGQYTWVELQASELGL